MKTTKVASPATRYHVTDLIALIVLTSHLGLAVTTADGAGDALKKDITLKVNGADVTLSFIVCPRGTMIDGRPDREGYKTKELTTELWILETEVSYATFCDVFGKRRADKILDTNIATNESMTVLVLEHEKRKPDLPMHGVTIDETLDFCKLLQAADPECQLAMSQIAVINYRLPTHMEWQYACRAVTTEAAAKKLPHFPHWASGLKSCDFLKLNADKHEILNDQAKLLDAFFKVEGPWTEVEKKKDWDSKGKPMPEGHKVKDYQSVFESIASTGLYGLPVAKARSSTTNVGLPICGVDAVPIVTKDDPATKEDDSLPKEQHVKNAWGIYHMHDNVSELTLADNDMKAIQRYYVDGGSDSINHTRSVQYRDRWFIWGGMEQPRNEVDEQTGVNKPIALDTQRRGKYGFRVARTQDLSDTWFDAIRLAAHQNGDPTTIQRDLDDKGKTVSSLSRGQPFTDKITSIVALYKFVANRRGVDARPRVVSADSKLEDEISVLPDPYFAYLGKILKDEKSHDR